MPELITTTVYCLDELDAAAREKARSWYREGAPSDDFHDAVYDDFERICGILGIALAARTVRLFGGGTRQEPCIWFSGFWSQGDGACFEGSYAHARSAAREIRAYAPQDIELHRIADALSAIQRRNFYQLEADVRHQGRYYHEYTMAIAVERASPTGQAMFLAAEEAVIEALRNLARWLYQQLEREYAYRSSDEMVDEAIVANDYTFTDIGRRFP